MTPLLWVQRRSEQREAAPQAVPAWGYGSVHAESPHPRGLRGGAICGSYRASGSVRRAISVPLCPLAFVRVLRLRSATPGVFLLGVRFVVIRLCSAVPAHCAGRTSVGVWSIVPALPDVRPTLLA